MSISRWGDWPGSPYIFFSSAYDSWICHLCSICYIAALDVKLKDRHAALAHLEFHRKQALKQISK